jgi:phosphomannomutase
VPAAQQRIHDTFADRANFENFDGATATAKNWSNEAWWWFNVRASNTEPLLRLNVEASDEITMQRIRDEVLQLIRK